MRVHRRGRGDRSGAGFTLAEVAVTIAIVGIALTISLQTLNAATLRAGHIRSMKTARELGLFTLGEIEAGLLWEEIDEGMGGSYSELDFPNFYYEVVLGDEAFLDDPVDDRERPFDNWAYQEELRRQSDDYDEDEEEEAKQPYEKVRVKVVFPTLRDARNDIVLERWVRWEQVYGPDEDELDGGGSSSGSGDTGDSG